MPMAYSLRKKVLSAQPVAAAAAELVFLQVLFTKHPKSPSSWEHRRWCLLRVHSDGGAGALALPAAALAVETTLCAASAEAYPKNYYAWMHRKWLLAYMNLPQLAAELAFTRAWLLAHVSDHTAGNHRDQVVQYIAAAFDGSSSSEEPITEFMRERAAILAIALPPAASSSSVHRLVFLESVLAESRDLITQRPGHETLWYHRRNTFHMYINVLAAAWGSRWATALQLPSAGTVVAAEELLEGVEAASGPRAGVDTLLALLGDDGPADSVATAPERLHAWWVARVGDEVRFAASCAASEAAWDQAAQRTHALRYRAYVLFLAAKATDAACVNAAEGPTPTQQALHTALHTALAAARAEDKFDRFWGTLPLPIDTPSQRR